MKQLQPIRVLIHAPRVYVFQALTSFGEPSHQWFPGREPEVLERQGSVMVVCFYPRVLGRIRPSVQRVRLYPPSRITYEQLTGPLADLREEITLSTEDGATRLDHHADIAVRGRFGAGLVERLVTAPLMQREMQRTVDHYRVTIEAAARAAGLAESCIPDTAHTSAPPAGRNGRRARGDHS